MNMPPSPAPGRFACACRGWTLVELTVALGVSALLATLAWPAYQAQQQRARRSDGQLALMRLQLEQSRHHLLHGRYTAELADLQWPDGRSAQGHYQVQVLQADAQGFLAQALALGAQQGDRPCHPLHLQVDIRGLQQRGAGLHTDSDPDRCWRP